MRIGLLVVRVCIILYIYIIIIYNEFLPVAETITKYSMNQYRANQLMVSRQSLGGP